MNDQSTESPATITAPPVNQTSETLSAADPSLASLGSQSGHLKHHPAEAAEQAGDLQKSEGAQPPFPQEISINDLQNSTLAELQELADAVSLRLNASRTKHQLIYDLCSWLAENKTRLKVEGVLEIGMDNYGLIRYPKYSFTPLPEDVFVPLFLVRKFNLRPSQKIAGFAKAPKDRDKYLAIDRITEVEGMPIENWQSPTEFDKLTATFPNKRIILETPKPCAVSSRILDIVAPLGKGQRGLICAPPRSGKTVILKDIAKSISQNHKEITLIVLLLDERPEEVTDFEETVQGCEIYSSTFDESPKRHSQVAEIVRERACRLVEMKKDVVILLDSITRLARGYNAMQGGKGAIMSGGVGTKALQKPKKFFGAARNVEEGGSLTIIATALIETESRMDEVIFEEFKGTGNMEATLDREISERRIYPALHLLKSGTRRDDLLYHPDEFKRITQVRKQLAAVPAVEALELLIRNINRTSNNAEILLMGLK
ncbi:transcription termination factor Rho [Prosthecobacter sp.]|uniref:transcription termination factor Rho n=1 Tax=Prosthecobacter sp. TaxID=1965333 RepID=UPI002ABBC354|nr:transcription termination factor Rho [Prosthecobacter sp.]MDZ4403861.1 transcription termination factor Rho [Prosthecobacter sp.]